MSTLPSCASRLGVLVFLSAAYTDRNRTCPEIVNADDLFDIFALATLLEAGGVPLGSLDSTLDPSTVNSAC